MAYKIFKPKNPFKVDKGKDKDHGSLNVKLKDKKQAPKKPYQGTNRLSQEEMEQYRKEHRCFRCGTTGHTYRECPQCQAKSATPKVSNVMTTSITDSQDANCSLAITLVEQLRIASSIVAYSAQHIQCHTIGYPRLGQSEAALDCQSRRIKQAKLSKSRIGVQDMHLGQIK